MKSVPVTLDDEVDAALEQMCAAQGRSKGELVSEVLRRYVETERLRRTLEDPALAALYEELAAEDTELAEGGIAVRCRIAP